MSNVKIFVIKYDKNNNVTFIICTKLHKKLKKLCSGIFNFEYGWCALYKVTPFLLKNNLLKDVIDCLEEKDWNIFKISKCDSKIREQLKKYVYNKHKQNK